MTQRGLYVVFEGADGVGKTTQVDLVARYLARRLSGAREIVSTREPGGTPLGRGLREAVMHGDHVAVKAEALLYAADRAHHISTLVRPALVSGAVVLQDRYIDSSIVYQGVVRALGPEIESINRWATDGLVPDLTIVLDRAGPHEHDDFRDLDRVERETIAHADQIRQGFLDIAAASPATYVVIDASRSVAEVAADVQFAVENALKRVGIVGASRGDASRTLE